MTGSGQGRTASVAVVGMGTTTALIGCSQTWRQDRRGSEPPLFLKHSSVFSLYFILNCAVNFEGKRERRPGAGGRPSPRSAEEARTPAGPPRVGSGVVGASPV